jgi:hypothetical protein
MPRRRRKDTSKDIMPEGKPAPKNASQLLMSVGYGKKEYLIPTVVSGVQMEPKKAVKFAEKYKLRMGPFNTHQEADRYSQRLSAKMGTPKRSPAGRRRARKILVEK